MIEQIEVGSDSGDQLYNLFSIGSEAEKPIQVNLTVNQKPLTVELDTGHRRRKGWGYSPTLF